MNEKLIADNLNHFQRLTKKVEKNKLKINNLLNNPKKIRKINSDRLKEIQALQDDIGELKKRLRTTQRNKTQKISFSRKKNSFEDQVDELEKLIDIMQTAFIKQLQILTLIKNKKK